jgi:hypothetical protein
VFSYNKTLEEWLEVAKHYQALWHFPRSSVANDKKKVVFQSPRNSVNVYFNYKIAFSIVLFPLVDANYNLMFVDAGYQGRVSNSGTLL